MKEKKISAFLLATAILSATAMPQITMAATDTATETEKAAEDTAASGETCRNRYSEIYFSFYRRWNELSSGTGNQLLFECNGG